MGKLSKYVDPAVLAGISKLDLRAKLVVEGFITGLHRSPFHGYSIEFAEHRAYVPGDDLKHIDWKVLGRKDRYYVKLYEEETNLKAYMLVDCSRSMKYKSEHAAMSKYDYACTLGATLAYLLLLQQDAVGMCLFDNEERAFIPPSTNPAHLNNICTLMETTLTEDKTNIPELFSRLAERFRRKGLVIVISDLFAPPEHIEKALQHFHHNKHEILVFHIMDHQELAFGFEGNIRFEGLEFEPSVTVDAKLLAPAYRRIVEAFRQRMQKNCTDSNIDYVLMDTSKPMETALGRYLHMRES